jgi:regulator of nucleoside diphosphate kinase
MDSNGLRAPRRREYRMTTASAFVVFTEADYKRLTDISALYASPYSDLLKAELRRGRVLRKTAVPKNLVTMNSTVRIKDLFTGSVRRITLVFPHQADPERGRISVLTPLGVALIGLTAGQEIYWREPVGARIQIRVLNVEYQPEAAGDEA